MLATGHLPRLGGGDADAHWLPGSGRRRRASDFGLDSGATRSPSFSQSFPSAIGEREEETGLQDKQKKRHGRRAPSPSPTSRPLPPAAVFHFLPVPCQTHSEAQVPALRPIIAPPPIELRASGPPPGSCPSAELLDLPFCSLLSVHTSPQVLLDLLPFLAHLSERSRVSMCNPCPFVAPLPLFCVLTPSPELPRSRSPQNLVS